MSSTSEGIPGDLAELRKEIAAQNELLRAILGVLVDSHIRAHPTIATSRFTTIDRLLKESSGLTNAAIGKVLGKTPQAVGQVLSNEKTKDEKTRKEERG